MKKTITIINKELPYPTDREPTEEEKMAEMFRLIDLGLLDVPMPKHLKNLPKLKD